MSSVETLAFVLLGCLLGALGQGARAIRGWKKNRGRKGWFDTKRFIVSFCIGAVAGGLASILLLGHEIDRALLISLVAAGYAGADFVEGFFRKHIKK
jgi:uncharacterized membrane protein YoaK (UPF0700 family)